MPDDVAVSLRPAMKGSVRTPMNWLMALNVVCWLPAAVSPAAWLRLRQGQGRVESAGNTAVRIESLLVSALPFC